MLFRYPRQRLLLCCLAFVLLFLNLFLLSGAAQKAGDRLPPEIQQTFRALGKELEPALQAKNEAAVYEIVAKVRKTLGKYAGVPESPEDYLLPVRTVKPDPDQLTGKLLEILGLHLPRYGSLNPEARENRIELREPAYIAVLCLTMAQVRPKDAAVYQQRAQQELDYLLARQHASGMFPYPANPGSGSPPNVRADVERALRQFPDRIWNGYLVLNDGGMQFDTGCCSFAMLCGYETTKNPKYLEAARKAGEWAMGLPMSTNWNYNAFSVWQLAALNRLTGEGKYLDSALEKASIGVLPGLMENGHWVDPHNAKQSYHFIMVRALSELLRNLPATHPRYQEIRSKTTRAAESRAREIIAAGPSNVESALWGLVSFLEVLGPNPLCEQAANAIVNASLDHNQVNPIAASRYLLHLKSTSKTVNWIGLMPADRREALRPLNNQLVAAMNARDRQAVQESITKIISAYGQYAGVPEIKSEYGSPRDVSMPDLDRVEKLWGKSFERMKGRNAFEIAPPPDAENQTGERLRTSLRACRAYLHSYDAGLENRDAYLSYARRGFDYMLQTQASNGVFGYPFDPEGSGLKKAAADIVARGRAQGKKMVEKGWVIDDLGEGGLQFDNGEVGAGLLYAYALTRDNRYLESARRAADWAIRQPLVLNWNYNSFSGRLLARIFRITKEKKYLEAAQTKIEFGVLPGQMPNGRWFDQHNARIQYHAILMNALVEYYLALLEAKDPAAESIKNHCVRGLDNLAEEITTYGASNFEELLSTDALCIGLLTFGPRSSWEQALDINMNYLCNQFLPRLEAAGYPMTETAAHYLLYHRVRLGKAQATEARPQLGLAPIKPGAGS